MDNSETLNPTTGKREWCLVSCKRRYCLCRLLSLGQCGSLKLWFLFASVLEGLASAGSGSLVRFTPQRNLSLKQIRSISNGVDICLFGETEFVCIQILSWFQTSLFALVIHLPIGHDDTFLSCRILFWL